MNRRWNYRMKIHESLAPLQYCEMLEGKYGDYMRLVRDAGGHDYPFFEAQKKQLQAVLDFLMPEYKFAEEQLCCEKKITTVIRRF